MVVKQVNNVKLGQRNPNLTTDSAEFASNFDDGISFLKSEQESLLATHNKR